MKKQAIPLKINSIILSAQESERNLLFYLNFPPMWIWYAFWPAKKINLIQTHFNTILSLTHEFASLTQNKHFNISHANKLHDFLQACITDQYLLIISQVISDAGGGYSQREEVKDFFEDCIRSLSEIKNVFKRSYLNQVSKDQLIRDIKQL